MVSNSARIVFHARIEQLVQGLSRCVDIQLEPLAHPESWSLGTEVWKSGVKRRCEEQYGRVREWSEDVCERRGAVRNVWFA